VLPQENREQVKAFLARQSGFAVVPPEQVISSLWERADDFAAAVYQSPEGLLMTPRKTGTDGFFVSVLKRSA
jgi:16S rRNA (cytosine967-C5)-methyltransferase